MDVEEAVRDGLQQHPILTEQVPGRRGPVGHPVVEGIAHAPLPLLTAGGLLPLRISAYRGGAHQVVLHPHRDHVHPGADQVVAVEPLEGSPGFGGDAVDGLPAVPDPAGGHDRVAAPVRAALLPPVGCHVDEVEVIPSEKVAPAGLLYREALAVRFGHAVRRVVTDPFEVRGPDLHAPLAPELTPYPYPGLYQRGLERPELPVEETQHQGALQGLHREVGVVRDHVVIAGLRHTDRRGRGPVLVLGGRPAPPPPGIGGRGGPARDLPRRPTASARRPQALQGTRGGDRVVVSAGEDLDPRRLDPFARHEPQRHGPAGLEPEGPVHALRPLHVGVPSEPVGHRVELRAPVPAGPRLVQEQDGPVHVLERRGRRGRRGAVLLGRGARHRTRGAGGQDDGGGGGGSDRTHEAPAEKHGRRVPRTRRHGRPLVRVGRCATDHLKEASCVMDTGRRARTSRRGGRGTTFTTGSTGWPPRGGTQVVGIRILDGDAELGGIMGGSRTIALDDVHTMRAIT